MRHLRAQTARDRIELIVVAESARAVDCGALQGDVFAACRVVEVGPITQRGDAAAKGIRAATAPIVAMIEDHSYPEPEWAEALLRAHAGPWTVVGPVVANANPDYAASWVNYVLGVRRLRPAGRRGRARPASLAQLGVQARRACAVRRSARHAARVGGMAPGRAPRDRPHAVPRARGAHAPRERLARVVHRGAQPAARPHPRRAARDARALAVLAPARCRPRPFRSFPCSSSVTCFPACGSCRCPARCGRACSSAWARHSACSPWPKRGGWCPAKGDAIGRMEDYELHRTRHLSRRERRDLDANEPRTTRTG